MPDQKAPAWRRYRWFGQGLQTLIEEYPTHGAQHVADKLGESVTNVRCAVAYYGLCRIGGDETLKDTHPIDWPPFSLTKREAEVLRAVASGCGAKPAADALRMSVNNLNQHLGTIYRKFGVDTMVAATLKAERAGLLEGVVPVTVERWELAGQGPAPQAETKGLTP